MLWNLGSTFRRLKTVLSSNWQYNVHKPTQNMTISHLSTIFSTSNVNELRPSWIMLQHLKLEIVFHLKLNAVFSFHKILSFQTHTPHQIPFIKMLEIVSRHFKTDLMKSFVTVWPTSLLYSDSDDWTRFLIHFLSFSLNS